MPFEFNMIFQSLDWFLKRKRAACSNWAATMLAQRRSGPGVLLEAELGLVQPAGPRARRQRGGHGPVLGWCFRLASRPVGLLAFGGGEKLRRPGQVSGGWQCRCLCACRVTTRFTDGGHVAELEQRGGGAGRWRLAAWPCWSPTKDAARSQSGNKGTSRCCYCAPEGGGEGVRGFGSRRGRGAGKVEAEHGDERVLVVWRPWLVMERKQGRRPWAAGGGTKVTRVAGAGASRSSTQGWGVDGAEME